MKTETTKTVRRTLGTLQPSALDQAVLVGSGGKVAVDKKKVDTKRRRLNFDIENQPPQGIVLGSKKDDSECKDRSPRVAASEITVHVDPYRPVVDKETYNLTLRDDPSTQYWMQLAEERRVALEKALEENRQLHHEVEILEAENGHLQKIADHCGELAEIVKTLTADDEGDEDLDEDEDELLDDESMLETNNNHVSTKQTSS